MRLPLVPIVALASLVGFALVAITTLGAVRIGSERDQQLTEDSQVLASLMPAARASKVDVIQALRSE